jgi:fatty-acid desaturase
VGIFIVVPMLALLAAVPLAWGWGLTWVDIGLAVGFYVLSGLGVTVGFHRYFTHRAFKANRGLRTALAVAGSMALQGDVITWVADHRRHHAFADKEGDPHSPWLFGTTPAALARGFWHAHTGWLFNRDRTNAARFTPDLLADRDIARISRQFPLWTLVSLLAPALLGGVISMSMWGALTALFWAGLVRVAVLHHVTWSINSICHMIGERPFAVQGKATKSGRWLCFPWANRGTTCTTPTPPAPATACSPAKSTFPPASSKASRSLAGPARSAGPRRPESPGSHRPGSPEPRRRGRRRTDGGMAARRSPGIASGEQFEVTRQHGE